MFDSTNNRTSVLVSSQLPAFVRDDHETFVKFIEEYYRFLEQNGQLLHVTKNFNRFLDPNIISNDILLAAEAGNLRGSRGDTSYHVFLQKLWDNFLALVPDTVLADRTLILKHAKDFYRSTGSEKSVRFLMRILFNKEVSIYYPKKDILKASDGKWYVEKSIKIRNIAVDNVANTLAIENFTSRILRGVSSNASAIVERIEQYYEKGVLVIEAKLSSVDNNFINNEQVFVYFTEEATNQTKYLSANLYGGTITTVTIRNGGSGYIEGTEVPLINAPGDTGTGASIIISSTSTGKILELVALEGGAGFKVNDLVNVEGGGGSGANGAVTSINDNQSVHPNTYTIMSSIIRLEQNTPINNTQYSNLNQQSWSSTIGSAMSYWRYANTGPISTIAVIRSGGNYKTQPQANAVSNTLIHSLGILGRMQIVNGGLNYTAGDKVEFINQIDSFGYGAMGNVTSVAANGMIQTVRFEAVPGFLPGGSGYEQSALPTANVRTTTGSGASIVVKSILGAGDYIQSAKSAFGSILRLSIASGGTGYLIPPTLDFSSITSGTGAVAVCETVSGSITYPGKYLSDDGFLSGYKFLEDRDYYQNYSYVIRVDETIDKYRKPIKELIHPGGMKLFGEYLYEDQDPSSANGLTEVAFSVTQET